MTSTKFWVVSAMAMPTKERVFQNVQTKCGGNSQNFKFNIPQLRVGTLDALMSLCDDLVKADYFVETTTRKIGAQLHQLMAGSGDAGSFLSVDGANADVYLTRFTWMDAKFPIKMSCRELTELIQNMVGKIDDDLRTKLVKYNALCHSVTAAQRKKGGSLMVRELTDLVKKEHVQESEYLTTVFVVVPSHQIQDWNNKYEKLTEFVVPRSAQVICEESDCTLVSVVCFRKAVDDFKVKCRENRFTVRDFTFNEGVQSAQQALQKILDEQEQLKNKLLLWCKTNFGEAFTAWVHLKAIRTHVESILRYGLPANYQAVLMWPKKGSEKKLTKSLEELFAAQTSMGGAKGKKDADEAANIAAGINEPFYPYVFFEMELDMSPK